MEKNDWSKLVIKLNMDLSYCNNLRLERTRMNYAIPQVTGEHQSEVIENVLGAGNIHRTTESAT